MKTTNHSRRLRNAHQHDETHKEPFFSHSYDREQRPFFNAHQGVSGNPVQAKLTIGKPGDRYERQADRVASKVVARGNPSPDVQKKEPGSVQRVTLMSPAEDEKLGTAEARMEKDKLIQEKIQRMETQEEEQEVQAKEDEEEVQAKEDEEEVQAIEEEEKIQAQEEEEEIQAKGETADVASADVSQKIKQAAGGGRPMSGEILAHMERAFAADFSSVRIHTGAEAAALNRRLHAQAFTRGQDIFFGEGKYRPETGPGKVLLAHELTHVVQQKGRKPGGKR